MAEKKAKDAGQKEVQSTMDEATERGYLGSVPDPTPNSAYTIQGVTSGAPTPETDRGAKAKADEAAQEGSKA